MFPPLGAHTPASRILRISSFGTGSGLSRRIERVVLMISNRSVLWFSFGMAFSRLAQPRLSDRAGWCKDRLRRNDLLTAPCHLEAGEYREKLGVTADIRRLKHR